MGYLIMLLETTYPVVNQITKCNLITIFVDDNFMTIYFLFFSVSEPSTISGRQKEGAPKARRQYTCPVCKHPKKGHKNVDCPKNRK